MKIFFILSLTQAISLETPCVPNEILMIEMSFVRVSVEKTFAQIEFDLEEEKINKKIKRNYTKIFKARLNYEMRL